MTDYKAYISVSGITPGDFIRTVRQQFPNFTKIQKSMICAPQRYGVQLLPEAEALLVEAFGAAPGLACAAQTKEKPKKPAPVRTKPHRLVVYLSDETNGKVRELMQRRGFRTVQEFLSTILTNLVRIEEERKERPHEENL